MIMHKPRKSRGGILDCIPWKAGEINPQWRRCRSARCIHLNLHDGLARTWSMPEGLPNLKERTYRSSLAALIGAFAMEHM